MENQLFYVIKEYLKNIINPIVFEIGVNDAEDTKCILQPCMGPKYYGFEPDPNNLAILNRKGIDKIINLYPYALDIECGTKDFYLSNTGTSSSLLEPKNHLNIFSHVTFDKTAKVETITIRKFCDDNQIDHIDFIWMDAQGSELDILLGAGEYINKIGAIATDISKYDELYKGCVSYDDFVKFCSNYFDIIYQSGPDIFMIKKKS
jgi:FkbM family methyltransferase